MKSHRTNPEKIYLYPEKIYLNQRRSLQTREDPSKPEKIPLKGGQAPPPGESTTLRSLICSIVMCFEFIFQGVFLFVSFFYRF